MRYLTLILCLLASPAFGAVNIEVGTSNIVGSVIARAKVTLTPVSVSQASGVALLGIQPVSQFTDTNGSTTFSNVVFGTHRIDLAGTPGRSFQIVVSTNLSGNYSAVSLLSTSNAPAAEPQYLTLETGDSRYLSMDAAVSGAVTNTDQLTIGSTLSGQIAAKRSTNDNNFSSANISYHLGVEQQTLTNYLRLLNGAQIRDADQNPLHFYTGWTGTDTNELIFDGNYLAWDGTSFTNSSSGLGIALNGTWGLYSSGELVDSLGAGEGPEGTYDGSAATFTGLHYTAPVITQGVTNAVPSYVGTNSVFVSGAYSGIFTWGAGRYTNGLYSFGLTNVAGWWFLGEPSNIHSPGVSNAYLMGPYSGNITVSPTNSAASIGGLIAPSVIAASPSAGKFPMATGSTGIVWTNVPSTTNADLLTAGTVGVPVANVSVETGTITSTNSDTTNNFQGFVSYKGHKVATESVVNVLDYGAIPDGTGDNASAFNTAIAQLSTTTGGKIVVPPGTYNFDSSWVIPTFSSLVIVDIDLTSAVLQTTNAIPILDHWTTNQTTANMPTVFIRGGTFSGNGATNQVGIRLATTYGSLIEGTRFTHLWGGVDAYFCLALKISKSMALANYNFDWRLQSGTNNYTGIGWPGGTTANSACNMAVVEGCRSYGRLGMDYQLGVFSANRVMVRDCIFEGASPTNAIRFMSFGSTVVKEFTVENTHGENTPVDALVFYDTDTSNGGAIVIDGLRCAASMAIINATNCGYNNHITIKNVPYLIGSPAFIVGAANKGVWKFENIGSTMGTRVLTATTLWSGGIVPSTFWNLASSYYQPLIECNSIEIGNTNTPHPGIGMTLWGKLNFGRDNYYTVGKYATYNFRPLGLSVGTGGILSHKTTAFALGALGCFNTNEFGLWNSNSAPWISINTNGAIMNKKFVMQGDSINALSIVSTNSGTTNLFGNIIAGSFEPSSINLGWTNFPVTTTPTNFVLSCTNQVYGRTVLTNDANVSLSGLEAGRSITRIFAASGAARTISFPTNWKWWSTNSAAVGDTYTNTIADGKSVMLSILCGGDNDTNVNARLIVMP